MAKTLIWAVALIVSALILASGGLNAQRVMIPPEDPAPPPADSDSVPVAVTNFPTVDIRSFPHIVTVEGTVDVGNFPATQNVAGTVDVGNLPLDADGNVRVSGIGAQSSGPPHLVGVTQDLFQLNQGIFPLARACHQDFPNSRPCTTAEIIGTVNPPTLPVGPAWVLPSQTYFWLGPNENLRGVDLPTGIITPHGDISLSCKGFLLGSFGIVVDDSGQFSIDGCEIPRPVACCGY